MPEEIKDEIVKSLVEKFIQRSNVGIAKYGTTLFENRTDDFLTHLQEELMDACLYVEKLKTLKDYHIVDTNKMVEISDDEIEKSMRKFNITDFGQMSAYVVGAKWYREQLKQRQ